ncbi:hypothetical protein [Streptomyces dioscori]|uniref:hypothetical protein n=1 Tax=Streptomyces dioscori TaxID=2109333 RepID=UPI00131C220B|nr:hypothetical protein [Streptomyces dioscori]
MAVKELGPSCRGGDLDGVAAWLAVNARARTADAFAQSLAHTISPPPGTASWSRS